MNNKQIQKYLEEAIDNIREDRKKADSLLKDIASYIGQSQDRHREVGLTAAKYLETLQRSNEQLVKIAALVQRSEGTKEGFSKSEKENIFDLIKEG